MKAQNPTLSKAPPLPLVAYPFGPKAFATNVIWGGAVADAIGNPLEFKSTVTDKDFGVVAAGKGPLMISDDTQMTLFLMEALLGGTDPKTALLRWYATQRASKKMAAMGSVDYTNGLMKFKSMHHVEAPGGTCMGSCATLSNGWEVMNDSKGNGTVMRAAPFALMGILDGVAGGWVRAAAKADALLTHKHPFAWMSSVLLCEIYLNIYKGLPLGMAVTTSIRDLPEVDSYIANMVLAMFSRQDYDKLRSRRCGWVAEEALALAIGSVLHHDTYLTVVKAACQGVSSDSDTVAGIAGGLAAAVGMHPCSTLKDRVVAKDAIKYITDLI